MNTFRVSAVLAALLPLFAQAADNVLHPGVAVLDRPTLTALGVQLPVTGDDNYNSSVTVQYRRQGDVPWKTGLPLYRVHPDTTLPYVIAPQFSGSIVDLRPATTYEIQLHIADPDGPVDQTLALTATTRPIPGDPATPHVVNVSNADALNVALGSAQPGDIITLANGTYPGSFFSLFKSGTPANPVVIRGASQDGVIVDGGGCDGCNIFELYGSYIHVERITIQNGERAIKFQSGGAQGNVVRRVRIRNVVNGIGSKGNQLDFYIADNIVEGRLAWPLIYTDNNGADDYDDGIRVEGHGHVISHNRISGFGDAMKVAQDGSRANDFYGNDILWDYDNGVELDGSEGNVRLMRNRFTNTYNPISAQPIYGGPAYIYRNVATNTVFEALKLHSVANPTREPSGIFIYNNTFVSAYGALILETPTAVHHFAIENNLFIGPRNPVNNTPVDFFAFIDDGLFDYNGYWPDGFFAYNYRSGRLNMNGFAALQQAGAGLEPHGLLVNPQTLASGIVGPADYRPLLPPADVTLASTSIALDRSAILPNISDTYTGAAPDLGALELGCPPPLYGPRPEGTDETNEPYGCSGVGTVPIAQSITVVAGTPQSVLLQGTFAALQAKVVNASLQPVAGVPVTFTAPASGASATFSGGAATATVGTDAAGVATAPAFTANGSVGSYAVSATSGALPPATFSLTNLLPPPPTADTVTGPAGVRINQSAIFTFKYSSAGRFVNLTQVLALINSGNAEANGCSVIYDAAAKKFFLRNDAGTANAGSLAAGATGSLQNSQCTLNGSGSAASGSGNTLTVTLSLAFTPAFLGTRQIFLSALDQSGQSSGWQNRGTLAISLPDHVLHPGAPVLDRPTLISLGIQMPVTGDENYNSTVTVQYRKSGETAWKQGLPLFRVHPDTTLPYVIAPQFAGSLLDLRPATTYEIQLHATDPDGTVDQTFTLSGTTRAVPGYPATPRMVNVADVNSLNNALTNAQPGDIINVAGGVYFGQFALYKSGTAANPIVLRGASQDGTVLDGQNCSGCNILELYGSYIQVERLTIQSGERGIKYQTVGSQGNVVRRVRIWNVLNGIATKRDQLDSYIVDNIVEGQISWPSIYPDDNGAHDVYDGIHVEGHGNVIAHNRLSGFGDAMKVSQDGARANDFYGNDILWDYDNGVELDGSEGNVRLMRNRFTNTYNPISAQPIFGGPAYIYRNVAMNTVYEELKLHSVSNPTREPNGVFIYNNTFVSAYGALILETPTAVHHFALQNNLFIGPRDPVNNTPVDFFAFIDNGLFDYNGYWPDGFFAYNYKSGRLNINGFAALQQAGAGLEPHGMLVNPQTLASGIVGPANYKVFFPAQDFTLSAASVAIDRGTPLPNITEIFNGAAPDLGALEAGCPAPVYGPRAEGTDETNEPFGCSGPAPGVATTIAAISGTPQSIPVQTVAPGALQAKVLDGSSKPVVGAPVKFTAPPTGASGAFSGSASANATTDASGIATAPAFTANATTGSYTVNASVSGVANTAAFVITNTAPLPASLTAIAGTPQTVTVQAAFAALQVKVLDASAKPVSGAKVTFTAPSSGASATFAGGALTATATSDAAGIAIAPTLTANTTAGTFTVAASFGNLAPASFSLISAQGILLPASVSINPGEQGTLMVTLSQPAPSGGVFVKLVSADTTIVSLNVTNILIREGETTSNQARLNGNAIGSAAVTVSAPGYSSGTTQVQVGTPSGAIKLAPSTLVLSAPASQNLTLSIVPAAPAGGVTVTLASSNAAMATVPGTVTIAANATTASVPVTAVASGAASITATLPNYGSASANVNVTSGLAITTAALAAGQVNAPYSQTVDAAGGTKPYTWTLLTGTLPTGLTLNSSLGWIGGIPTAAISNTPLTFQVTDASVPAQTATANFTLTSAPANTPASIAAVAGTPQSTNVNTAFASPLSAVVKDSGGNPMSGVTVTFAVPAGGASGAFAGGVNTAVSNIAGMAVSPVFTANGSGGAYTVTAAVTGVAIPAAFSLTNVSGPALQMPASIAVNPGEQTPLPVVLSVPAPSGGVFVTLASSNNAVASLTVTSILIPEGQTTSPRAKVAGGSVGTATITATAPGFAGASTQVQVGTQAVGMSFAPASLTLGVLAAQNLTLTLSSPAPSGGVTVTLSSSNPAVASVGGSVSIAANATSASVPVTGLAAGAATITASTLAGYTPASASIMVTSGLAITTSSFGSGKTSALYLQLLEASGGAKPYNWSLISGALPTGVTLDPVSGLISGTPTAAVNATPLTFKVTDSSVPQQSATASFALTISSSQAGAAVSITAVSGTPQSSGLDTAFPSPFTVLVKDAGGNPVNGVVVTFTTPAGGASGSFAGGVNTATTNSAGMATSAPFTANSTPGSYTVSASAPNVPVPASFSLANTSGAAISLPATLTIAIGEQAPMPVTLSAPAPSGGIFLTVVSSNPAVVAVNAANVLIPEGQTVSGRLRLNGLAAGSATITASAPGFQPGTVQVKVGN